MVRVASVHAIDERDVIHAPRCLGKERAHRLTALAVLFEIPLGALQENALVARPVLNLRMITLGNLLAVVLDQLQLQPAFQTIDFDLSMNDHLWIL